MDNEHVHTDQFSEAWGEKIDAVAGTAANEAHCVTEGLNLLMDSLFAMATKEGQGAGMPKADVFASDSMYQRYRKQWLELWDANL